MIDSNLAREKTRERKRRYYWANRAKIAEWKKINYRTNPAKVLAACRRYRETHQEACRAKARRYREKNLEKIRARGRLDYLKKNRERVLKKKYGISTNQYESEKNKRNGKCDACGIRNGALKLDHCHNSGSLRGFLCNRCNITLGVFEDNPQLLRKLVEYLEQFELLSYRIGK